MFNRHVMIASLLMLNIVNYAGQHTPTPIDYSIHQLPTLPPLHTLLAQDPYQYSTNHSPPPSIDQQLYCIEKHISQQRSELRGLYAVTSEMHKWSMQSLERIEENQLMLAQMLYQQNEAINTLSAIVHEPQNTQHEKKRKREQNEQEVFASMQPPTKRAFPDRQPVCQTEIPSELIADLHYETNERTSYAWPCSEFIIADQALQGAEQHNQTDSYIEKTRALLSLTCKRLDEFHRKTQSERKQKKEVMTSKESSE